MNDIGKRIKKLRNDKGMTQLELANLLFVTDKTISSFECNRTMPSLDMIVSLSEVLDTTSTYLLYGNVERLDIETEIKIKLTDDEYEKIRLLMQKEARFVNESSQRDTYYNPKYNSFLGNDVIKKWLRIGERGGKLILNYKNWYDVYCDEYEVLIDDKENMDRIFKALGLEIICVVDKKRETYLYLDKYEVALDRVKDLGCFIEIEVKKYDDDVMLEYDKLLKLAKNLELDLNRLDKRGYPYYLLDNYKMGIEK